MTDGGRQLKKMLVVVAWTHVHVVIVGILPTQLQSAHANKVKYITKIILQLFLAH